MALKEGKSRIQPPPSKPGPPGAPAPPSSIVFLIAICAVHFQQVPSSTINKRKVASYFLRKQRRRYVSDDPRPVRESFLIFECPRGRKRGAGSTRDYPTQQFRVLLRQQRSQTSQLTFLEKFILRKSVLSAEVKRKTATQVSHTRNKEGKKRRKLALKS